MTQELLTRDQILQADDIQELIVDVPEWLGKVKVRGMTGTQRDAFENDLIKRKGKDVDFNMRNARAKMVSRCVIDEKGKRVFSDQDVTELGNKSAAALDRVFSVAQKLSGVSDDDIKELTENLAETQSGNSGSG